MEPAGRYWTLGGVAGWRVPIVLGGLALALAGNGEWTAAVLLALAALAGRALDRTAVLEVSAAGLVRGRALGGPLLGPGHVVPWRAVEEISTQWRGPGDVSGLVTVVRARDGTAIRFTSHMGLGAYHALLADVAARAPAARLTGLTAQLLREPAPRGIVGRLVVLLTGTLAAVLAAVLA